MEQGNVFRLKKTVNKGKPFISIPLEQGNVFRHYERPIFTVGEISIPLEQGNVFRPHYRKTSWAEVNFNPFGTGQCLSTQKRFKEAHKLVISIPLEQGNVFRHMKTSKTKSFNIISIPLEQGNVFRLKITQSV